ncbi:MAG: peptidoglycan DD-metalloendopeptidase family protein [Pseudomonadota bacterium]
MAETLTGRSAVVALVLIATGVLAGCPGAVRWNEPETRAPPRPSVQRVPRSGTHTVRAGESLHAIATRYGLSAAALARWNRLGSGELIFPGQTLRLTPPANSTVTGPRSGTNPAPPSTAGPVQAPDFIWPARGKIRRPAADAAVLADGISIVGQAGSPIVAAADGQVVYSGSGLIGYGHLIIVKHNERFLTAYGYNDEVQVAEGDSVRQGQKIAQMGTSPDRVVSLHFEIRLDTVSVDPLNYLDKTRLSP